ANLGPAKAAALGQPYWIKPELGSIRISFHMHVPWFVSVSGVEEQPIGSAPEDRRHGDDCKPASPVRRPIVSLTLAFTCGRASAREPGRQVQCVVSRAAIHRDWDCFA